MKIEELSQGIKVYDRTLEQMGMGEVIAVDNNQAKIKFDEVLLIYKESDIEYLQSVN